MNFNKVPELIPQKESHKEEPSLLQKMGELSPQIVSFLAVLSASNAAFAADLEANTVQSKVENAIVSVEDSRLEVSPEVDAATRERFGVSIYDVCEQTGCEVVVEKPSANGKYIIHMGQSHKRPPVEMLVSGATNAVIESQEIIYKTLQSLNNPTIIEEGFTDASDRVIPKTSDEAKGELFVTDQIINSQNFGVKELQNYLIYKFSITEESPLDTSYVLPSNMQLLLGMAENVSQGEVNSIRQPEARIIANRILDALQSGSITKNNSVFSYKTSFSNDVEKSALFAIGATYKLQLDGHKMLVLPGETEVLNSAVRTAVEINNSFAFDKAMEDRDNYAVVAAFQSGDTLPIVVYGAAHDFTDNLEQNNAPGYGVIRIKTNIESRISIVDENGVEIGVLEQK
jgi:hypothetical protein